MTTISPFSEVPASSITATNNTPAGRARAAGLPEPTRVVSQAEWRKRRRQRLLTQRLSGPFIPSREIADVAEPLAARLAALARADRSGGQVPSVALRFKAPVVVFADAAHELISAIIGWQAEVDGLSKTGHLAAEPGKRRYALNLIKDTAQRPELPMIGDRHIRKGSWAADLTAMAAAADGLRVASGYSDRLGKLLRETVDLAALDLERKVSSAESNPPVRRSAAASTDHARAELQALGVQL
jgi:hypothetical protein